MAKKWKVWIDQKSVANEILKSNATEELVRQTANEIRDRCGDGYDTTVVVGRNRITANVYPVTFEAMRDNSENNTLLKAVKR